MCTCTAVRGDYGGNVNYCNCIAIDDMDISIGL